PPFNALEDVPPRVTVPVTSTVPSSRINALSTSFVEDISIASRLAVTLIVPVKFCAARITIDGGKSTFSDPAGVEMNSFAFIRIVPVARGGLKVAPSTPRGHPPARLDLNIPK